MEKLCKNCKYWKPTPEDFVGIRKIDYVTVYIGDCNNGKLKYNDYINNYPPKNNELIYWDYNGYRAYLKTGPDFGCIHWEQNNVIN